MKKIFNYQHLFSTLLICFFSLSSAYSQFWVVSGSKGDSISRVILDKYKIDLKESSRIVHSSNKENLEKFKADSIKLEYQTDPLEFNLRNSKPYRILDKNIYTHLIESPNSEEIELSLDSVFISPGSYLYFISKDLYEFAGPIGAENLKKGFKRSMNTSMFGSNGIYIILVEPNRNTEIKSNIKISRINFKDFTNAIPKARVAGVAPSSHCYPQFNNQAYAVGRISSGGGNGSFSILNNESFDRRPFILTAHHVFSHPSYAASATYYVAWRYNCGSTSVESTRWVGTGANYLAFNSSTDHFLAELDDDLPMSINYMGWDRATIANGTLVYGIHHPSPSPYNGRQHYSSGFKSSNSVDDKHTIGWSLGETKNGSSGSPLFRSSDNKVIGALSWGTTYDRYVKFSNTWSGTGGIKPFLSNINNYSTLAPLIPTAISGPKILCYNSITTYSMPNLISGESVTWSVSGGLQILSSTANSVTVKAVANYTSATITATFTVIKNADDLSQLLTDNRIFNVWLGGPSISVTNTTTNHTSGGYSLNMSTSSSNNLVFNNLSEVSSVSWTFPGSWSTSGSSGFNISVWSWSGSSPFTVNASNVCGSNSANFFPNSSGFRLSAKESIIFPNVANNYVKLSLLDSKNWQMVRYVRIIDSRLGVVHLKQEITDKSNLEQVNGLNLDTFNLPKGKYILEVQYTNTRDSHHLIVE